jgi:class 3 adenylate cyclase
MCDSLHVAKIETVGKTYLACAGLRDFEFESTGEYIKIPHAKRCLDLAFTILSSFRNYPLQINQHLEFHIGINTGPVIAGVVGYHKPQFSLVGDTVNTSSRMSSTLTLPNTVQISSSTFQALSQKSAYEFLARLVPVKGKGEMETYEVKRASYAKRLSVKNEQEDIVLIPQQRSSVRRGSAQNINLHMSEIKANNEKKLKEKVGFFAWKKDEIEMKFEVDSVHQACIKLSLILFPISTLALFASRLILEVYEVEFQPALTLVYFLVTISAVICRIFIQLLVRLSLMPWLLLSIYTIAAIACSADYVYSDGLPIEFIQMEIGFICALVYHFSAFYFRHAVIALAVLVLPVTVIWAADRQENISFAVFILLFGIENCAFHYFFELNQRKLYNASTFAMREIEKTEQLLTQMMPVHAYESLRHAEWSTDRLLGVSILYADISGFTAWSSQHQPHEVIEKLSKIFTLFDKICVKQGLYKVHTIGDCYVALSSTTNSEVRHRKEECVRMVAAALDMVKAVDEICREDHELLKMRIGVHAGDVVAGITGSRLVRYDIYGPDVLIANKMESNGREGKVNVSTAVKALLEAAGAEFLFERNKTVEVPDIGVTVDCYFVSSPVAYVSE